MSTNDFKPFAASNGANVTSQDDYEALAALSTGFSSGKASSAQVNKALRQGTVIASVLAQFIADNSGNNVLDDGDTATLADNLLLAINAVGANQFLAKTHYLSEIAAAGPAGQAMAQLNLGISANLIPVGVPLPWPTATAPTGWLKCNGAAFTKSVYPQLALVYPLGTLPDLRGEFIRGWDDDRGVDTSRVLLSAQSDAIRNITGQFLGYDVYGDSANQFSGAFKYIGTNSGNWAGVGSSGGEAIVHLDASLVVPIASENRPRNIAFNYIVRAA